MSSFVQISLQRHHALMVKDGAFRHKIGYVTFFGDSKILRASKSHYWFKSLVDFDEWMDYAYWWRFSGEGSAIIGASLSSCRTAPATPSLLINRPGVAGAVL